MHLMGHLLEFAGAVLVWTRGCISTLFHPTILNKPNFVSLKSELLLDNQRRLGCPKHIHCGLWVFRICSPTCGLDILGFDCHGFDCWLVKTVSPRTVCELFDFESVGLHAGLRVQKHACGLRCRLGRGFHSEVKKI